MSYFFGLGVTGKFRLTVIGLLCALAGGAVSGEALRLLNEPVDVSPAFADPNHTFFFPENLTEFDPRTGEGKLRYQRKRLRTTMLFNDMVERYDDVSGNEWPNMYAEDPELPFSIEFITENTVRVRMKSKAGMKERGPSLMLVDEAQGRELPESDAWTVEEGRNRYVFTSAAGSIMLRTEPWSLEVRNPEGKVLTRTLSDRGFQPFCFVRRYNDYSRSYSAVFSLEHDEKIFGGGESFTGLNKRGQKMVLSTTDPLSTEKPIMYKPVPFFLSSRGYGVFVHTSAPTTFDVGATHSYRNTISTGDDELDLFIFLGEPREVIGAYTALTGRAAMPPLWSFGLWMSRITYKSEEEARTVARRLRENRIPCDVIHLDTGWFETDWMCDYEFSKSRFPNPKQMIADLKEDGFHVSLWQLPYFVPDNPLFGEIVEKGLAVVDSGGNIPYEDAVLDFSNPDTVAWYQEKIGSLLELGVSAIKTDFGEAAPGEVGLYASGSTGYHEHNLYPLRYQQAAAEITKEVTGDAIIWARAGWAGAQRNPVHWGGDAPKDFHSMAASLRAGLSIGVSGFSFWSHDIGGFAGRNDVEVYRKWLPFGAFTSHARVHGEPPKEPWEFGEEFVADFREFAELRYRLMPYIHAQAKSCTQTGLPMLRALFIEYPEDPGAWLVEDQYLFGTDFLVAPIFGHDTRTRQVYLPGEAPWIDYQSGAVYEPGWREIEAGEFPGVILVRNGAAIPHVAVAQSTRDIDWSKMTLQVFARDIETAEARICLPGDDALHTVRLGKTGDSFTVEDDPLAGEVAWKIETK